MANIKSNFLGKNSRQSVRDALDSGTLIGAIIPLGSTEQHNEHLAMEQDSVSAEYIAAKLAQRLSPRLVVTPTITMGSSPHHMNHPGTISLRDNTLFNVLKDVVASLTAHGIKNIFVINGHGGNVRALKDKLTALSDIEDVNFHFISYWDVLDKKFIEKEFAADANVPGHAGIFETSFALAAFPENVDMTVAYPEKFKNKKTFERDHFLFEESRNASAALGKKCITYILNRLVDKVNGLLA